MIWVPVGVHMIQDERRSVLAFGGCAILLAACGGQINSSTELETSNRPTGSDSGTRSSRPPVVARDGGVANVEADASPAATSGNDVTTRDAAVSDKPTAAGTGGSVAAGSGGSGGQPSAAGAGGAASGEAGGSYTVTGSWPARKIAISQKPGSLVFTKIKVDDRFLAESCSIADYNRDGIPDISAGRRWWSGPFGSSGAAEEHVFRSGHDGLPRTGAEAELYTGVSDDWACYAEDVDRDGFTDIINITCPDVDETMVPNAAARQRSGTAVWYKNPGASVATTADMWKAYPMHDDVRGEQHGLSDVDGDGLPEIYGACKSCGNPGSNSVTRGFYQIDPDDATAEWTYHVVTQSYPWPGGGWLHGFGFGDVNKDGKVDLLERAGVWTNILADRPDTSAHYDVRLYGDLEDPKAGGSHMFSTDVDGDDDMDIITADLAHAWGISWYEQTAAGEFKKHKFVGTPEEDLAASFSQPHALEVVDMDGDGISDVIAGKSYLAHPEGLEDPDLRGDPVNYVFKIKRNAGAVELEPHPIDTSNEKVGIGRQIAVGHIDTDGIMDICIASKLGVHIFLGQ
jgi:hypothetical protein